jgi:Uma2 family endonuclease
MATDAPRVTYSPAEYLARERVAETKSEYLNGEIVAMTGASRRHKLISLNIGAELRQQLRGNPCETYTGDMRVRVGVTGLYTYPDVVVACPPILTEDAEDDTLLNPVMIAEVVSPAGEAYDRGEKFRQYRRLESLREYVLVAQDAARIERYARQGDVWVLSEVSGLDAVLSLDSIGCAVRLADAYDKVESLGDGQPVAPEDEPPPTG